MKAITLTQPWATLVAIGAKRIETRSWQSSYRGPLAIHAAKGFPRECRELCLTEPFRSALRDAGYDVPDNRPMIMNKILPLGCIVATCELTGVYSTNSRIFSFASSDIFISSETGISVGAHELFRLPPAEPELSFGDYSPGRYAWVLGNIKPLAVPIPAKGSLSLWEWEEGNA